jgi:hypothetical protein
MTRSKQESDIARRRMNNAIWETKDGRRRVRRDPPTIEEAVLAAQGLAADDLGAQTEIVASLMQISADEARTAVLRMGESRSVSRTTIAARTGRAAIGGGAPRTVVVERRVPRRSAMTRR